MLKTRSRESPRAHYAKAFVHCLSFPRHCAFQLHTRARILARSRHPPALFWPSFFFLFAGLSSPCLLFLFVLSVSCYLSRTRKSFLFSALSVLRSISTNESTHGLLFVVSFPAISPTILLIRCARIDSRSALGTLSQSYRPIAGDNPKCHPRPWF